MRTELPAFAFGFFGVVFALLAIFALLRGSIREGSDVVIYRSSDPFRYYMLVLVCVILSSLLIFGSVYCFRHPGIVSIIKSNGDSD
jgi:hypothetical protein